ncbi:MAG: hypothetical protein HOG49_03610 [Candidatus Scalindua sp.]|jgi:hypothetical protein|nr:hypothetical protein [Candidatus Scalindua sp.]
MNRREQYEDNREYIHKNCLDKLINFEENIDYSEGAYDSVNGKLNIAIPPEANDLVRLHKLIREKKPFTVMEFGVGFSTLIIADALYKNKEDWELRDVKDQIRNRYMFRLFSVDVSRKWIEATKCKIPTYIKDFISFHVSNVVAGTYRDQICHYYKSLPDIVPDFIYVDGPASRDVKGSVHGLTFSCDERTVMSADLLLMEPVFTPGLNILIDGRTNNARFLERNFTRNYSVDWDKGNDITLFSLEEDSLGKYNKSWGDYI